MNIIGETIDGKYVVDGVYYFYETKGLPLEFVFEFLKNNNMVTSWVDYLTDARKNGASYRTIKARIKEAISDVHGKKYFDGMESRLDEVIEYLQNNNI